MQQNAGGGLRVTNPGDLQRNGGKQEVITKAPTPRRHTVTVGGMDLEMGQKGNPVYSHLCLKLHLMNSIVR